MCQYIDKEFKTGAVGIATCSTPLSCRSGLIPPFGWSLRSRRKAAHAKKVLWWGGLAQSSCWNKHPYQVCRDSLAFASLNRSSSYPDSWTDLSFSRWRYFRFSSRQATTKKAVNGIARIIPRMPSRAAPQKKMAIMITMGCRPVDFPIIRGVRR